MTLSVSLSQPNPSSSNGIYCESDNRLVVPRARIKTRLRYSSTVISYIRVDPRWISLFFAGNLHDHFEFSEIELTKAKDS